MCHPRRVNRISESMTLHAATTTKHESRNQRRLAKASTGDGITSGMAAPMSLFSFPASTVFRAQGEANGPLAEAEVESIADECGMREQMILRPKSQTPKLARLRARGVVQQQHAGLRQR